MKRIVLCLLLAAMPVMGWAASVEDPAGLEQLRTAAQRGDVEAMLELGILYEFGYRLRDHNAPALAWYRLAAEAGNAKAGARHDALKTKLTAQEAEEANKLYAEYSATLKKPAPAVNATPPAASRVPVAPVKNESAATPAGAPSAGAAPTKVEPAAPTPAPAAEEKKAPSSESK